MDVIIIGAGGHGRVVLDILRLGRELNPVGFLDAEPALAGSSVGGLEVLGAPNQLVRLRRSVRGAIVAIGDNRVRAGYARLVEQHGLELVNAVHPASVVSPSAQLGRNVVIAAGAVAGVEARIADSCILNTHCVVDHECELAEAVHVAPAAALGGRVRVGARTLVGLGSRILPCIQIGEDATIGAGSTVIRDVPSGATVVGVPARPIRSAT